MTGSSANIRRRSLGVKTVERAAEVYNNMTAEERRDPVGGVWAELLSQAPHAGAYAAVELTLAVLVFLWEIGVDDPYSALSQSDSFSRAASSSP